MARHPIIAALMPAAFAAATVLLATAPASAGKECECIGNGKRVKEGEVMCLQIGASSQYLARCERVLNNTSWKKVQDGCPTASLSGTAKMSGAAVPAGLN